MIGMILGKINSIIFFKRKGILPILEAGTRVGQDGKGKKDFSKV